MSLRMRKLCQQWLPRRSVLVVGEGEMWYDGGVRSFGDLGEKGFREGFGFFSGEGETCGSDLKM